MSSTNNGDNPQPTPKEMFFMLHVLNNQEGKPKVNWEKVAEATGLKNAATAHVRFGQIKKRIGWNNNDPSAPAGKATAASTKMGSGTNVSPSKVTKPRGRGSPKGAKTPIKSSPGKTKKKGTKKEESDTEREEESNAEEEESGEDEETEMENQGSSPPGLGCLEVEDEEA